MNCRSLLRESPPPGALLRPRRPAGIARLSLARAWLAVASVACAFACVACTTPEASSDDDVTAGGQDGTDVTGVADVQAQDDATDVSGNAADAAEDSKPAGDVTAVADVASDGAVLTDTVQTDAAQTDAAQPDAVQPDAVQPDTAQGDTGQGDTSPTDSTQPDASPDQDVASPDAVVAVDGGAAPTVCYPGEPPLLCATGAEVCIKSIDLGSSFYCKALPDECSSDDATCECVHGDVFCASIFNAKYCCEDDPAPNQIRCVYKNDGC